MRPRLYVYAGPPKGPGAEFTTWCMAEAVGKGWALSAERSAADLAVAPVLRRKLSAEELGLPLLGTLVHHPSLLPARRGPDAVKWQFYEGDDRAGSTWFWPDEGLDTGPICVRREGWRGLPASPGELYERAILPVARVGFAEVLELARVALEYGVPMARVEQLGHGASYQSWHPTTLARRARAGEVA